MFIPVTIIEPTEEDMSNYGYNHGSGTIELSVGHIEALKTGKMLAWNDGEYTTFIILNP